MVSRLLSNLIWFKSCFRSRFKTKDLRPVRRILSLDIIRDRDRRLLIIYQGRYIDNIMTDLDMTIERHRSITLLIVSSDGVEPARDSEALADESYYRRVISKILYLSRFTRPDIAFATGKLTRHVAKPIIRHMATTKHLLRFIRSTRNKRLVFGREGNHGYRLIRYSDTNYAATKE